MGLYSLWGWAVWPREAVLTLGMDKVVFRKEGNGFRAHRVQTGIGQDNLVQITGGMSPADSVARNAQFLVDNESFIKVARQGAPLYELYSEELNNAKQEYILALERRKLFISESVIDFDVLIQSARNKLRLWGMAETQVRALSRTNKASLTTTFYSTASGYITELSVVEGAYVAEGSPIVQLANLSTLWAEAQVYSSQWSSIIPNSMASVP